MTDDDGTHICDRSMGAAATTLVSALVREVLPVDLGFVLVIFSHDDDGRRREHFASTVPRREAAHALLSIARVLRERDEARGRDVDGNR